MINSPMLASSSWPVLGVIALALAHQRGQQGVAAALGFAGPGQVVPGHEIGEIGAGEIAVGCFAFVVEQLIHVVQALVVRERRQHGDVVAAKAGRQQQVAFGVVDVLQIGRRQHAQQRIAELAAGELLRVVLDLVEQDRHEIDHAADLRMAFEMRRHVDVVLHGVQVDPGQDELAGRRVASADF